MTQHLNLSRIGAAAAMLLLAAGPALARPDVSRMSCAQAQALIEQSRAIVVTTGPTTYDRYVSGYRYCEPFERFAHPAYVRTQDNQSCQIGYTCQSWDPYLLRDD